VVTRSAALLALIAISGCTGQHAPTVPPASAADDASPTPLETPSDPRVTGARIAAADKAAWQVLVMRPLRLPALKDGRRCPLAPRMPISDGLAPALGDGPIYAVAVSSRSLAADGAPRQPNGFYELKVLWVATDAYRDPALIRGSRIDTSGPLRFNGGDADFRLSSRSEVFSADVPRTWRQFPSSTDVEGPGCYAWQVDGTTFTETIVFQVVP
jgi:hypothetical protein